jgi:hypothetical protein
MAGDTAEVGCSILGFVLSVFPNNENVKPARIWTVHEGQGTALLNSDRRDSERMPIHLDRIWLITLYSRGASTGNQ